jgi:hypothetical protein
MFCPQCGENNADSSFTCVRCGRTLRSEALPPGMQPVNVPNYLVFSILTTVFCCLPTGIPAIVYSAQVNGKLQAGDIAGAQQASKNAKMWCLISLCAGLALSLGYGIFVAVVMMHHR